MCKLFKVQLPSQNVRLKFSIIYATISSFSLSRESDMFKIWGLCIFKSFEQLEFSNKV